MLVVSILTRPEGRVQPEQGNRGNRIAHVSILTRPEGRVQLAELAGRSSCTAWSFNPHPSRRTGATELVAHDVRG